MRFRTPPGGLGRAAALLLVPVPLWALSSVHRRADDEVRPTVAAVGDEAPLSAAAEAPPVIAATPAALEAMASAPAPAAGALLDPALEPVRRSPSRPARFETGEAPFTVRVGKETVPYRVMAVPALPGATLDVAVERPGSAAYALRFDAGKAEAVSASRWRWTVPSTPGIHALRVEGPGGAVSLNVLVEHPRTEVHGDRINGYLLGRYREQPLRGLSTYVPPEGFVELHPGDADVLVSPHLALGQFQCKEGGEPKYLHLSPPLLLKLEAVLQAANAAGYPATGFHVMSGFRTPAYNRAIGNTTSYSRHLWGDAADVWVDEDGDGVMDDWNGDGREDFSDVRILYGIVEKVEQRSDVEVGGIGLYHATSSHGPFVHVDARGYKARW